MGGGQINGVGFSIGAHRHSPQRRHPTVGPRGFGRRIQRSAPKNYPPGVDDGPIGGEPAGYHHSTVHDPGVDHRPDHVKRFTLPQLSIPAITTRRSSNDHAGCRPDRLSGFTLPRSISRRSPRQSSHQPAGLAAFTTPAPHHRQHHLPSTTMATRNPSGAGISTERNARWAFSTPESVGTSLLATAARDRRAGSTSWLAASRSATRTMVVLLSPLLQPWRSGISGCQHRAPCRLPHQLIPVWPTFIQPAGLFFQSTTP